MNKRKEEIALERLRLERIFNMTDYEIKVVSLRNPLKNGDYTVYQGEELEVV